MISKRDLLHGLASIALLWNGPASAQTGQVAVYVQPPPSGGGSNCLLLTGTTTNCLLLTGTTTNSLIL